MKRSDDTGPEGDAAPTGTPGALTGPSAHAPALPFGPQGRPLRIWVVTDGRAGNLNPAMALAEGVAEGSKRGGEIENKAIDLRPGAALLPPPLWGLPGVSEGGWPFIALKDRGVALKPPYPDLAIGAGRRSAPFIVALRRLSGGGTRTVQILDPRMDPSSFDLVVAPAHDGLSGPCVLVTTGSVHNVAPESLAGIADRRLARLKRPLIGVLVGGPSKAAKLRLEDADRMIDALRPAAAAGVGLAATPSRRTPPAVSERLETEIRAFGGFFWKGEGANPYRAILAEADALVVTADSVNMASEAAGSGKPVFIARVSELSEKLQRFHRTLELGRHALPLPSLLTTEILSRARTKRLDDRGAAVARILQLIEPPPRSGPSFG